jgi:hypothetical protein
MSQPPEQAESGGLAAKSLLDGYKPDIDRSLSDLLVGVGVVGWDVIAFVDGSGSKQTAPGGYAAVFCTKTSMFNYVAGGITNASSSEAEMRAVFELVNYLLRTGHNRKHGGLLIQLITDNTYVANTLAQLDPLSSLDATKHTMILAGLMEATRLGVRVVPHHLHRNRNPLMVLADALSKQYRVANDRTRGDQLLAKALAVCETDFPLNVRSPQTRRLR